MSVIDLKSPVSFSHAFINNPKAVANVYRALDLFTGNRFLTSIQVLQMCLALSHSQLSCHFLTINTQRVASLYWFLSAKDLFIYKLLNSRNI